MQFHKLSWALLLISALLPSVQGVDVVMQWVPKDPQTKPPPEMTWRNVMPGRCIFTPRPSFNSWFTRVYVSNLPVAYDHEVRAYSNKFGRGDGCAGEPVLRGRGTPRGHWGISSQAGLMVTGVKWAFCPNRAEGPPPAVPYTLTETSYLKSESSGSLHTIVEESSYDGLLDDDGGASSGQDSPPVQGLPPGEGPLEPWTSPPWPSGPSDDRPPRQSFPQRGQQSGSSPATLEGQPAGVAGTANTAIEASQPVVLPMPKEKVRALTAFWQDKLSCISPRITNTRRVKRGPATPPTVVDIDSFSGPAFPNEVSFGDETYTATNEDGRHYESADRKKLDWRHYGFEPPA